MQKGELSSPFVIDIERYPTVYAALLPDASWRST